MMFGSGGSFPALILAPAGRGSWPAFSRSSKYRNTPNIRNTEAMVTRIRAMATLPMAQTLTSACSYRISGMLRSGSGCRVILFSAMFERLRQLHIVERHQRPLLQLHEKGSQPDPGQPEGRRQVQPAHRQPALGGVRHYLPVHIHQPHRQNEQGDSGEQLEIALQVARQ